MSEYSEFFFNGPSRIVNLETLEIFHPSFSKTYWIVLNSRLGITARLENTAYQRFDYYPAKIIRTNTDNTLDQAYKISLGDLGEILPQEIDRCRVADTMSIRPIVRYRTYRSDNLQAPLLGPMKLEVVEMPFDRNGVAFEAKAPTLNLNQTGEYYDLSRFPGLRGWL